MIFGATQIDGERLIDIEPHMDDRGFFARTWCNRELAAAGLDAVLVQESMSFNIRRGTLRGLHFQRAPYAETKIVRCLYGAILDVTVDLRPDSPTYLHWQGIELTSESHRALYIPKGVAHGFQTLCDNVEVAYQMSTFHVPEAAGGYRYDDPVFGVVWPLPVTAIGARDLAWPGFAEAPGR